MSSSLARQKLNFHTSTTLWRFSQYLSIQSQLAAEVHPVSSAVHMQAAQCPGSRPCGAAAAGYRASAPEGLNT